MALILHASLVAAQPTNGRTAVWTGVLYNPSLPEDAAALLRRPEADGRLDDHVQNQAASVTPQGSLSDMLLPAVPLLVLILIGAMIIALSIVIWCLYRRNQQQIIQIEQQQIRLQTITANISRCRLCCCSMIQSILLPVAASNYCNDCVEHRADEVMKDKSMMAWL